MKKIVLCLAFMVVPVLAFAEGVIPTPWNIAVDSTSWTAITASQRVVEFQVRTRDRQRFKISASSTGSPYYTVASDTVIKFDLPAARNAILFYIQTIGTSDTLEVLLLNK